MLGAASCTTRRRGAWSSGGIMATEEDEIQLVDRTAGDEEEDAGDIFDREDDPTYMKIDYSGGEDEEEEESEPRVEDEKHIKHPGKFRLRLRVRFWSIFSLPPL